MLARRDPIEAMRVAAGLTIHDHQVQILFLCEADLGTEEAKEYLELLEFSDHSENDSSFYGKPDRMSGWVGCFPLNGRGGSNNQFMKRKQ